MNSVLEDKVILEMGSPAQGATYEQILDATKPMLFLPIPPARNLRREDIVTTIVVEHLCNEQQRRRYSAITYQFEKEDGTIEWRKTVSDS